MAAATITSQRRAVVGDRALVTAQLAAVADTNTFDTGLIAIDPGGLTVSFHDASAVAADSIAVDSVSGGVITFQVAGTARAIDVSARGY